MFATVRHKINVKFCDIPKYCICLYSRCQELLVQQYCAKKYVHVPSCEFVTALFITLMLNSLSAPPPPSLSFFPPPPLSLSLSLSFLFPLLQPVVLITVWSVSVVKVRVALMSAGSALPTPSSLMAAVTRALMLSSLGRLFSRRQRRERNWLLNA